VDPAVNVKDIESAPALVAVPIVGAPGTVVAVTAEDAVDATDVPKLLRDLTVYVYCVDDCNPVTIIGLEDPVNDDGVVAGLGVTS